MRADLDIPIHLDRTASEPVGRQLVAQLRRVIADGMLRAGDHLPSTRLLAQRLGIARSTVVACYLELEGEGWVTSSHGAGTYVADTVAAGAGTTATDLSGTGTDEGSVAESPEAGDPGVLLELRPGDLDPSLVPAAEWRRSWQGTAPAGVPAPPAGTAGLRADLAAYLGSSRGLRCQPEEIVVCAGTQESLLVLALGLRWAGRAVAVEDPGYPPVRRLLAALSVAVTPFDVSGPGHAPAALAALAPAPAAVYLTPSHQYPLGHRMTTGDRNAVLDWSDDTGAVLIEDDYDSEFRFDVAPVPSMAGSRPDSRVAYLGTLSKVLDPGLRVAYVRVPPVLLPAVLEAREILGTTVPTPVQQAVSRFIRSGELSRHIARMRRVYAERREVLLNVLADIPGVVRVGGLEAGLHAFVELDPQLRAADIVASAAARGLRVADLDEFRSCPEPARPGLLISYSAGEPAGLRRAGEILSECIKRKAEGAWHAPAGSATVPSTAAAFAASRVAGTRLS